MSHSENKGYKFGTLAIHAGQKPDPTTGAIITPIYQTSTFVQEYPGKNKGYDYARGKNPTRTALQDCIAALENAKYALSFSSGMAACDAIVRLLKPGDEIIATDDLYGGAYRMFTKIYEPMGFLFKFVNMQNAEEIHKHFTDKTKMVWIETPTNPTCQIIDIESVSKQCKIKNIILVTDNTFASPYLQNPLTLGADIVIHSATKYLGGHSDVVMGATCTNDDKLQQKLALIHNSCGAVSGPMDSFLVLRGIKTLHIRMERHCENGKAVAHYLKNHPKVDKVYWPGFADFPNHEVAKKQMKDFGGMLSFSFKDDSIEKALKIASSFKVFSLAESLGGVESLIGHPASMTHASIPKAEREKNGITDSLLRLSIGIENIEDLLADLEQAIG